MHTCGAGAFNFAEPGVEHKWDVALHKPLAQGTRVAVAQSVIQHGSSQAVVLNKDERMAQGIGRGDERTDLVKGLRDIHGNKRFILDNEDRTPFE
jgi:hypothetical protein